MDYNAILRATDRSSVGAYVQHPPAAPKSGRAGIHFAGDIRFATTDIGSRNDANAVQPVPTTRPVKHYVVIDASQRNWVLQPNPYSNLVYSFGSQSLNGYSPPVYTNNAFVPTFGADSNGILNTQPGRPNTTGWYLPGTATPFPAYNSSLPKGNFLAYDTGYTINPSGLGFGSVFSPSNVQSIRLVRALLPQRQFLNVPVLVTSNQSQVDPSNIYGAGGVIQSNVVGKAHTTFGTYPYLLFNLNEYPGKYVGGNEAMRKAFSVMTQKTRTQTNFGIDVGVQHYDYEPWNEEVMVFQSPITSLQQVRVTVTDPIGLPFTQNDALNIVLVQTDPNALFLKCFTGASQYFNSNELRVGDRVIFDPASLSNVIKAPLISGIPDKVSTAKALLTNSFPVLQLLDYVLDPSTGTFIARAGSNVRTTSYSTSYNGFLIPNFLTSSATGDVVATYPAAADTGNSNVFSFPVQYNTNPVQAVANLPFLNISLQPTYTLELTCLEPDTGALGGHITQ
jgi:hypothetical protein